jgi:DNA-binding MarR family transcriptional regulator
LSSGSQEQHAAAHQALVQELRRFQALGASFFRATAGRSGLTDTDLQVIEQLDSTGPMTAGQLAELTGLTTGAITGMLNRLVEAGLVRRERDPHDGRRVIVRLVSGQDEISEIAPFIASLGRVWDELASDYSDEQLAFLAEFLNRGNAISRREIGRLRATPPGEGDSFSAPLGQLASGRLVVSSGVSRLTVRADDGLAELYQARFQGPVPAVKVKDGAVTIRYPRRPWIPGGEKRAAEVVLNVTIPWRIMIQGGAADVTADLQGLDLAGLEVAGDASSMRLELPVPAGVVPIRISGSASDITVRRPPGVAARVHLKGWVSEFKFDGQTFSDVSNDVRLHSPGYSTADPCYDIEVSSSASVVTVKSG